MSATLYKIVHHFEENSALLEVFLKIFGKWPRAPLAPVAKTSMNLSMNVADTMKENCLSSPQRNQPPIISSNRLLTQAQEQYQSNLRSEMLIMQNCN